MKRVSFDTPEALSEAAAALLIEQFQNSSETPSAIMLSGGKTPLSAYARVAATGTRAHTNAFALFSDERMVPSDDPESNYAAARPMLDALHIPPSRMIRVPTEEPLDSAAVTYAAEIARFLDTGGRIPLGLLGLGPDGHTASLFSAADVERGGGRYAIPVKRPSPPDRVSVTPLLLAQIERIIFLVSGNDKSDILRTLQETPHKIPAGLAIGTHPTVEIWTA